MTERVTRADLRERRQGLGSQSDNFQGAIASLTRNKRRKSVRQEDEDVAMAELPPDPVDREQGVNVRPSMTQRTASGEHISQVQEAGPSAEAQPRVPTRSTERQHTRLAARGNILQQGDSEVIGPPSVNDVQAPPEGGQLRRFRLPNASMSAIPSDKDDPNVKAVARLGNTHTVYRIGKSDECTYRVDTKQGDPNLPNIQHQNPKWRRFPIKSEQGGTYKYDSSAQIERVGVLIFAPKKHCLKANAMQPDGTKVKNMFHRKTKDRICCYGRYEWSGTEGGYTWETRSDTKRIFNHDNDRALWLTLVAQELLYALWHRQQTPDKYPQPIMTRTIIGKRDYEAADEMLGGILPPWSGSAGTGTDSEEAHIATDSNDDIDDKDDDDDDGYRQPRTVQRHRRRGW